MIVVLVAVAGALGAVLRLVVDGECKHRFGWSTPWQTTIINVTGSFVLGVLAGLVTGAGVGADWQVVLGTGFCGGYTTFSTASVETIGLLRARRPMAAAVYAGVSLVISLAACAAGLGLVYALA
ncbi:fluoride efflux transporter CrcB [Williamsia phyllosphaerae]|uniref:Fluoride-specific ion channel FluC n=1 Tax=Williamsia phyllosphaerae TaxID=885042 RepID=A0ABQ1UK18_9NOCA|nr:fluoride efflux transporter CrcB [Williamsia phyllosphaerae]GGF20047.1 putative fluoride ion transporter CrcB [Williamsia phyllosphaerae]